MNELTTEALLKHFPDSFFLLDEEGKVIFFNQEAKKYTNIAPRMGNGVPFVDIVSDERKEIVRNILKQVRTKRTSQITEAEYKDENGRSFFFEVSYSPVETDEPQKIRICVVAHDITHHKTFEKNSIQLLNDLSSLIENANALIFSVDSREYVTEWNRECTRVTRYEKNEVFARKATTVIDERSHADFTSAYRAVIEGGAVTNQELLIRTKEKTSITILVNATPKISSKKNVVGVLFVGQDITELSQYRSSLEEKVKDRTESLRQALEKEKELVELRNRFVSVASHELKMPLSTIDSSLMFLKTSASLNNEDLQRVSSIETQVGHMKSLLEDVLTVKKADEKKLKPNRKPLDLIHFLNSLSDEVASAHKFSHQVKRTFSSESLIIESDEKLLRNIFLNLLGNAMKFSPGKKMIGLDVRVVDNVIEVHVTDEGIGIEPQDLTRVFEPFNRGSNASEIRGTGLGLSIVKRAIEAISGSLTVNSVPQKGTRMIVRLNQK